MLRNDKFFSSIPSFVQSKKIDPITEPLKVNIISVTTMANGATKDTALTTDANLVLKALDCTSLKRFTEKVIRSDESR